MVSNTYKRGALLVSIFFLASCNSGLGQFGSSILSSTGLVTPGQAGSIMKAGEHIAKGVEGLSEEEEYYLGRGVSATVLAKYRPYRNAAVTNYVNKVGAVVAAVSDRPETFGGYHVLVLDTPEINAMSAPGGFIFVSTGFLKIVPDEDALAAVLAHEVAHVVKGHGVKAISEANLSQALVILGKEAAASQGGDVVQALTTTFGDSISDVTNTLLTKGYSRSQEYDADEYAAELLERAGYNPGGLVTMLDALEKKAKASAQGGWLSTHPAAEDRKDELGSVEAKAGAGQEIRSKRFSQAMRSLG